MARTPSVIITPAERKELIAAFKAQIKDVKADVKAFAVEQNNRIKARIVKDKEIAKAAKELIKDRHIEDQTADKIFTALNKDLAILEGKLAALVGQATTPTPASASKPTPAATSRASTPAVDTVPVKRHRRTKVEMEAARAAAA